jgi:hypothetical protein
MGIISLLGSVTIYLLMDPMGSPRLLVEVGHTAIVVLISATAVSVAWGRSLVTVLSITAIILIIGSMFLPIQSHAPASDNQLNTHQLHKYSVKHSVWKVKPILALTPTGSAVMFHLGAGILGLSMAIVYKPSLVYVRNRPTDDPPYPIWDSNHNYTTFKYGKMVPLSDLLHLQERYALPRYRYVLVVIGDKVYAVTPNSVIPGDSMVVRDINTKFFLGVPRSY